MQNKFNFKDIFLKKNHANIPYMGDYKNEDLKLSLSSIYSKEINELDIKLYTHPVSFINISNSVVPIQNSFLLAKNLAGQSRTISALNKNVKISTPYIASDGTTIHNSFSFSLDKDSVSLTCSIHKQIYGVNSSATASRPSPIVYFNGPTTITTSGTIPGPTYTLISTNDGCLLAIPLKTGDSSVSLSFVTSLLMEVDDKKVNFFGTDNEFILEPYLETNDGEISCEDFDVQVVNNLTSSKTIKITANSAYLSTNQSVNLKLYFRYNYVSLIEIKDSNDNYVYPGKTICGYINSVNNLAKINLNMDEITSLLKDRGNEHFLSFINIKFDTSDNVSDLDYIKVSYGETIIANVPINSSHNLLRIDISSFVNDDVKRKEENVTIEPITLTLEYVADNKENNPFIATTNETSFDSENTPNITSKYQSIGDDKNNVIISHNFSHNSSFRANLYTSNLHYEIPLTSIASNALSVNLNFYYDSRNLFRAADKIKGLPKGWAFNLSSRLIKSKQNNIDALQNEIHYIDGNGNIHTFYEKWYYLNNDGSYHLVSNKSVYLDSDQKYKFKDENGNVHEVTYEVISSNGLTYISSTNSLNMASKKEVKLTHHFTYDDPLETIDKVVDENGQIKITSFIGQAKARIDDESEVRSLLSMYFNDVTYAQNEAILQYDVYFPNEVEYKNGSYYLKSSNTKVNPTLINCSVVIKEEQYFALIPKYYYKLNTNNKEAYSIATKELELNHYYEKSINETYVKPDYYENENIVSIENTIEQYESTINDLAKQAKQNLVSLKQMEEEISNQIEMMNSVFSELINSEEQITASQINSFISTSVSYNHQIESIKLSIKDILERIDRYKKDVDYYRTLKANEVLAQKDNAQDFLLSDEGLVFGFDYYGRLIYISDLNENEITLKYIDDKLVEIASSVQIITINYDENGLLSSIIDSNLIETKFKMARLLSLGNNTDEIIFKGYKGKEEKLKFTYGTYKNLTSVENSNSEKINFIWDEMQFKGYNITNKILRIEDGLITNKTIENPNIEDVEVNINNFEITAEDNINNNKSIIYVNKNGEVIYQKNDDLDLLTSSLIFKSYNERNVVFDVSYEEKKLIATKNYTNISYSNDSFTLQILKSEINFTKKYMLAAAIIDFSNVTNFDVNNENELSIDVVATGDLASYTIHYDRTTPQIAIPIFFNNLVSKVTIKITSDLEIPSTFFTNLEVKIYEVIGEINIYDDDLHLLRKLTPSSVIDYEYRNSNLVMEVSTDIYGVTTKKTYDYDNYNRLIRMVDNLNNVEEVNYNKLGFKNKTYEYNLDSPSLKQEKTKTYDELGRLTNEDDYQINYLSNSRYPTTIVGPNNSTLSLGYDIYSQKLVDLSYNDDGLINPIKFNYTLDLLTSIEQDGIIYTYSYDYKHRKTLIKIGESPLYSFAYTSNYSDDEVTNGEKIVTTISPLNYTISSIYDKDSNLIKSTRSDNSTINYTYNDKKRSIKIEKGEESISYTYDDYDRLTKEIDAYDELNVIHTYSFANKNCLDGESINLGDKTISSSYSYDSKTLRLTSITSSNYLANLKSDVFGRLTYNEIKDTNSNVLLRQNLNYFTTDKKTLTNIKSLENIIGNDIYHRYSYDYDKLNNVTKVKSDVGNTYYKYDKVDRLIREDNKGLNKTITYSYDANGNLVNRTTYDYTREDEILLDSTHVDNFYYNVSSNKDILRKVNDKDVTFDTLGRLTSYDNHTFVWNNESHLINFDNVSYTYNLNGIRTSKTINGEKTTYYLSNNLILREKSSSKDIEYHYLNKSLIGFTHNGTSYIYEKNIFGDIINIYKQDDLTLVASYEYDAFGNHEVINHTSENIGNINPFRYRSYYYDAESNLYYLNARYYSPFFARFISRDELSILDETKTQLNGLNLYIYCRNNPIKYVDSSGRIWILTALLYGIIFAAISVATLFVTDIIMNLINYQLDFSRWKWSSWQEYLGAFVSGFISGLFAAVSLNHIYYKITRLIVDVVATFAGEIIGSIVTDFLTYGTDMDLFTSFMNGVVSGISTNIFGELTNGMDKIFGRLIARLGTSITPKFLEIISDKFENLISDFLNSSMYGIIENNKN